jgi:photosystem II stability/assembly factor-like uncharacterized protein
MEDRMIKKLPYSLIIFLLILTLAGCATTATPLATGETPTSLPATQVILPTSTAVPPTETPTVLPPTATATEIPSNAIQHYPSGQDFTVTNIDMIDATHGWAIGSLGFVVGDHVLFTTDGGDTWKDVTPPEALPDTGQQKAAIGYFQDVKTAWVTYFIGEGTPVPNNPVVWHTTDGGTSWTASQPLDMSGLSEIYVPTVMQFVAGQNGWILAHVGVGMNHDYVVIYRSTDGGSSWSRIIDPYNDGGIQGCTKNALVFTDATHGWLTGDCNGVMAGVLLYNSTDAGSTWQAITLPDPTGAPGVYEDMNIACGSYNPFFFGNELGHLSVTCSDYTTQNITHSFYFYTTQDGGKTWSGSSYPGESIYFFSADTGWALSSKIQQTTDGGKTWKPISDVTWSAQMDFISEKMGWAVARSATAEALVYSDDGGARWTEIAPSVGQ